MSDVRGHSRTIELPQPGPTCVAPGEPTWPPPARQIPASSVSTPCYNYNLFNFCFCAVVSFYGLFLKLKKT